MRAQVLAVSLVSFGFMIGVAPNVSAQDCGWNCASCGDQRYEGVDYNPGGAHNMTCSAASEWCTKCLISVDDSEIDPEEVASVLLAATAQELRGFVEGYGHRLLLNVDRNLIVVQGGGCNAEAIDTFVYVSAARARTFQKLGVRSLQEFIKSRSATAVEARS